jgi:protoporphyrinogen oxidase
VTRSIEIPLLEKKSEIIVLGAGLLGLRIADLLSQRGYRIELVEEGHAVGGMVGTFKRRFDGQDYFFDYGPHLFFDEFKEDYHAFLKDDLQSITGSFAMILQGKQVTYPLKLHEILKKVHLHIIIRTAGEVILNRLFRRNYQPDSLEEWMGARFGKILFNTFYAPYIEKCCGLPSSEVAVDWATERVHVTGNSIIDTIINRFKTVISRRTGDLNQASSEEITAYYPLKGAGEITDFLAERISDLGGTIHLDSKVSRVVVKDGSLDSIRVDNGNGEIELTADHYISTIPLPVLIRSITPSVPRSYLEASDFLKYRDLLLMYLILDKPRVMDHIEIFFPDADAVFKRIYEPKSLSEYMAPPERTSLCLEICCDKGEELSEDKLYQKAIRNLAKAGIVTPDRVLDYFTVRLPYAYPVYKKGFKQRVSLLLGYLGNLNNLTTIGRQGEFRYHAMTNETMELAVHTVDLLERHNLP